MHLLCPHCHNPIELVEIAARREVICSACGSTFQLEGGSTQPLQAGDGPRKLGRFELQGVVGVGAFGTVYRARDPGLDRPVALKVPRAGNLVSGEDRDRFLREARSAARLRHPGIVIVHEVGEADGVPYIVSELVHGVTLADRLTGRRPPPYEAARLIAAVADALQYAHEQGVVHRDVKPSNIMLDDDGTPRLMDFGLAKREAGEITVTVDGAVLGTPAYMSPEQAGGASHAVDGRGDVYSLGVILYQLLTGELPFRGNPRMLLHQVLHDEPKSPRALNDRVPRDLDTVCLKAMAKEPHRRYQTAAALADDLRRFLKGEPILARPVGHWERGWRWARRRPAAAALLAVSGVAVLALVALLVGAWYHLQLEARNRQVESALASEAAARQSEQEQRQQAEQLLARVETSDYLLRILQAEREWSANNLPRAVDLLQGCTPRKRAWEWHYLQQLCRSGVLPLPGLAGPPRQAAFAYGGDYLATLAQDFTVQVWDLATGRESFRLGADGGKVTQVAVRPDGRQLAGAVGPEVRVWNIADRGTGAAAAPALTLKGHSRPVELIVWSPDGKWLASADSPAETFTEKPGRRLLTARIDAAIKVWDATSGRAVLDLACDRGVVGFGFDRAGTRLAAAYGRSVKAWELTGKEIAPAKENKWRQVVSETARTFALSPDGRRAALGGERLYLGDSSGKQVDASATDADCLGFSPDGTLLAGSRGGRTVVVWQAQTAEPRARLRGMYDNVLSVAFTADGRRVWAVDRRGTVRSWDATADPESHALVGHNGPVNAVAFSPDGRRLASASGDNTVKVWDVAAGRLVTTFRGHTEPVERLAFSPDGERVASASVGGFDKPEDVKVWEAATGREILTCRGHTAPVGGIAFSPDGRTILTGGWDKTVRVWDAGTGKERACLRGHTAAVFRVTCSPDGGRVASAGRDGTVRVWELPGGGEVLTLRGHRRAVFSVAFSPDGRMLASASGSLISVLGGQASLVADTEPDFAGDPDIWIWDAATGRAVAKWHDANHFAPDLAFSPDSRRLATASSSAVEERVKVWDVALGQELLTLRGAGRGVAFSPDGKYLAAGTYGLVKPAAVKVWEASVPDK